jgi:lipid-A-disaccharide synthase
VNLLLVAGEVSGDQHAGALLDALAPLTGELSVFGVGGERCLRAGVRLLAHQKDLAVVGIVEALSKVRFARRLILRLVEEAVVSKADAAILIDSPDFNLPLARRLAARGIPVVFYVSPQVWAWRGGRARTICQLGRAVLVLFEFEKRWYEARGLGEKVKFVGHPLVDEARLELAEPRELPPAGRRRVVVMPGSREGEIRRLLPVLRDGVERLRAGRRDVDVILVKADSVSSELLREVGGEAIGGWTVVEGPHLALLASSDVLLVASGTATIEGVLTGIPMVVVYRVAALSYLLGRLLVKVKHVAMANILCDDGSGRRTVPELIQGEVTAERIAKEAAAFLDDPGLARRTRETLAEGRAGLGEPGAAARAAGAILAALGLARKGEAE